MRTPHSTPCTWAACVLLLAALAAGLVPSASAQPLRTLTIQDGAVTLDGERLPDEALPDSLDLSGIRDTYHFSDDGAPITELDGRFYTVEGEKLVEVDPDTVSASRGPSVSMSFRSAPGVSASAFRSRSLAVGGISSQALAPSALSARRLTTPSAIGTGWLARPQTEAQRYLIDMQRENEQLHKRLMQERAMEAQSQTLAAHIRALPEDSPEREALTDDLRQKLEEIFSMKEENRRRETEQLEKELSKLRDQLRKRERNREEIIDRRLKELIGERQALDW